MPVILKQNGEGPFTLGLWMIEESYGDLASMVSLNDSDTSILNSFTNPGRKIEWLSVRALLKNLSGNNTGIYYSNRKPYLCDHSWNISISHSHRLSSILMSRKHSVGIDLEYMSHRINNIASKFISPNEYITPVKSLQPYHLYVHWCAKEALYKICDKENIIFNKNLYIEPFEPGEEGKLTGHVDHDGTIEGFLLNYFKFENYIIVWCIK